MLTKLSWSHLLTLKDINTIDYYIFIYENQNLSVRELRKNRIKSKEYGKLPEESKLKLINKEELNIEDNLKKICHDKTNGIIICKKYNKFILEYCSDKRILSSEYIVL